MQIYCGKFLLKVQNIWVWNELMFEKTIKCWRELMGGRGHMQYFQQVRIIKKIKN